MEKVQFCDGNILTQGDTCNPLALKQKQTEARKGQTLQHCHHLYGEVKQQITIPQKHPRMTLRTEHHTRLPRGRQERNRTAQALICRAAPEATAWDELILSAGAAELSGVREGNFSPLAVLYGSDALAVCVDTCFYMHPLPTY